MESTLTAISQKQIGEWVNESFQAYVSGSTMRQPKDPSKQQFMTCQVMDPQNGTVRVAASFFGNRVPIPDGYYMIGPGLKVGEYNGAKQLTAFKPIKIDPAQGNIGTPVPNQTIPASPPAAPSYPSMPLPSASAPASAGPIHGATVGMAVNNAVNILKEIYKGIDFFDSNEFPEQLWKIASSIVRVSAHLEKGKLAPKAEERVPMQDTPRPPPPPPPVQAPPAVPAQEDLGFDNAEDVPF